VKKEKLDVFAYYCLAAGAVAAIASLMGLF
jgi:hypothetical protein